MARLLARFAASDELDVLQVEGADGRPRGLLYAAVGERPNRVFVRQRVPERLQPLLDAIAERRDALAGARAVQLEAVIHLDQERPARDGD